MIVQLEGYLSLIEYLSDHLSLFTQTQEQPVSHETIEDVVVDCMASNLMIVFEQNSNMSCELRFELLKEADCISADLAEVFGSVWQQQATPSQIQFLQDYTGLIKNLFDSLLVAYREQPQQ